MNGFSPEDFVRRADGSLDLDHYRDRAATERAYRQRLALLGALGVVARLAGLVAEFVLERCAGAAAPDARRSRSPSRTPAARAARAPSRSAAI